MPIVIRPAVFSDVPVMMALASGAATAAQWTVTDYERLFKTDVQAHVVQRHSLVLEEKGEVQAFIVARQMQHEWEIENIATAPDARRHGLGTRLLGEMMAIAYSSAAQEVTLEVRESNDAARALYEKWGFEQSGRRKAYYTSPVEDAIIFRFAFPKKFPEIVAEG
jgi:ribosomal-protein-alanine N-acetyltransferase